MSKSSGNLVPKLYYAVTPIFILLDYFCGINVRVAVLDNAHFYKGLYYGFCILCGVIVFFLPKSSSFVALIESIMLIMLSILGLILPYTQFFSENFDVISPDFEKISIVQPNYIINLVLAGGIAIITFHKSIREIGSNKY